MMNRILLFILGLIVVTACESKHAGNLSVNEAFIKYEKVIGDAPFILFPEYRDNPIKWFDSIPEGKIKYAIAPSGFVMKAFPGEFYLFQIGLWAVKQDVRDVKIEFSDLKGRKGNIIPSSGMTCFNKGGTDFTGKPFLKEINVSAGRVQSLWIGINLDSVPEGRYKGSVSVLSGGEERIVPILLKVSGPAVENHGYNEGRHLSRLNWLNSTVGIDDQVTEGYLPVVFEKNRINILGRSLSLSENGLPENITSYFDSSNQSLKDIGDAIVTHPFRFIVEKENGEIVRLVPGELTFSNRCDAGISWNVLSHSDEFELECKGHMEFDGFVSYKLKLTARNGINLRDIRLEMPVNKANAKYMMGLGHEGGFRTPEWKWKWDTTKNQDMLWVGAVNGGLRVKWRAENYERPLINIYYGFGPLNLPPSWGNEGQGGVNVGQKNEDVIISAYSGRREMQQGEQLNYDFELLITPLKIIDRQNKFGDRYYHGGGTNTSVKVANAKLAGANIINIHHAEDIYPFINYPYLDENTEDLKKLVDDVHKENLRIKFYYTTRELTKNLPEFWPFNSLNGEVIFPGPGNETRTEALHPSGPNQWLIHNVREKYIPAWYNVIQEGKFKGETDLSVITTPDSRLNNFYIAGLDWMVQNIHIDGVYIDDSALDRFTLQRARKVIDRYRPEGRMDLHSWNHFNAWAGFANCLNMYMDLLPYFDLVWIGEGRDYNRAADHWLIEVSGIPFGLPGQMLEGGGNPWRGMVYGITNRAGWVENAPTEIWKFWDEYTIADKHLIGYWEENTPVKTSNPEIKSTVYKGDGEAVISVANWTDVDQNCSLSVDFKKLGLDPAKVDIFIPGIAGFQEEQSPVSLGKITIKGRQGYLIVLKKK